MKSHDSAEHTPQPARTGRRPGPVESRDALLAAARSQFATRGYVGASVRSIATEAGVDPALIRHFFGDKKGLFTEVITIITQDPSGLQHALALPLEQRPAAITRAYLGLWESPEHRPILLATVRSAIGDEGTTAQIRDVIYPVMASTFMPVSPDDKSFGRILIAISGLLGTAIARHILKAPALAQLSFDELVELCTPGVAAAITPDHHTEGEHTE